MTWIRVHILRIWFTFPPIYRKKTSLEFYKQCSKLRPQKSGTVLNFKMKVLKPAYYSKYDNKVYFLIKMVSYPNWKLTSVQFYKCCGNKICLKFSFQALYSTIVLRNLPRIVLDKFVKWTITMPKSVCRFFCCVMCLYNFGILLLSYSIKNNKL